MIHESAIWYSMYQLTDFLSDADRVHEDAEQLCYGIRRNGDDVW